MCSPGYELLFSVQGTQSQNNLINMLPGTGPAARSTQNNMIDVLTRAGAAVQCAGYAEQYDQYAYPGRTCCAGYSEQYDQYASPDRTCCAGYSEQYDQYASLL